MEIIQNEPMSRHTSFKIGGPADYYIIAKTVEDVKEAINFSKEKDLKLTVIGNGTNVLVKDGGIRGVVLKIAITEVRCRRSGVRCRTRGRNVYNCRSRSTIF